MTTAAPCRNSAARSATPRRDFRGVAGRAVSTARPFFCAAGTGAAGRCPSGVHDQSHARAFRHVPAGNQMKTLGIPPGGCRRFPWTTPCLSPRLAATRSPRPAAAWRRVATGNQSSCARVLTEPRQGATARAPRAFALPSPPVSPRGAFFWFFSQLRGERHTADPADLLVSKQQTGAGRGRDGLYVPAGRLGGVRGNGVAP